jgi:hypothetical protein
MTLQRNSELCRINWPGSGLFQTSPHRQATVHMAYHRRPPSLSAIHLQEQLGRAEALTASVDPKHPFLTVLKKDSEQAEGGDDRANEPPQSKQCVGDLASTVRTILPSAWKKRCSVSLG